ncbi:hypothetical protein [Motilibacter deserti]|uniref:Dolichyl-phosphate-mannose-protein mannosyltransferase n=1 Tax=Motilibacter deserti TaxID=2714956 RepID=A0ABX0GTR4_9ACTN|nr:hypothetical protein [Motilibacter deserti]NHC13140.1 hypothetical protein [Motilibacter deserti]
MSLPSSVAGPPGVSRPAPAAPPRPAGSARAGRLLGALSAAPAAGVVGALAVAWPLLALGAFVPLTVALVALPCGLLAAAVAARVGARNAPPVAWWSVVVVLLVAVGAGVLAAAYSSEHLVLRRDPGAYALTGLWVAEHGTRDIPVDWAAFGGPDPALVAESPAYYAAGDSLVPQFLSGQHMVVAVGDWIGGTRGALVAPAVLCGLALLALGGLTARLLGGPAAALASAALALAYPVQHVARSTYSEPLAQLVLLGGLALLVDVVTSRERGSRWHVGAALLAGGVLGAATLVRVEALREAALLIPVCAVLAARRRPEGGALAVGLAVGVLLGALDMAVLAEPYVGEIRGSVLPLAVGSVLLAVVAATLVGLARGGQLQLLADWLLGLTGTARLAARGPALSVAAVLVVALALAVRPVFDWGRQDPASPGGRAVSGMQRAEGLFPDGSRTYAERTPEWVAWWMGWPALLLAVAGAAWLAHAAWGRRGKRAYAGAGPVLWVLLASSLLVLVRPGITPDHPWADRRLVPGVLPAVALCATAGVVAAARWARGRSPGVGGRTAAVLVAAVGALALLVPPALASRPLLDERTEVGEAAAVREVCRQFRSNEVALLLDLRARREWSQPLRGVCGVPTVGVLDRTQLARIVAKVRGAGNDAVLVAADHPRRISAVGVEPVEVVRLRPREDDRKLLTRPEETVPLVVRLWLGRTV